MRVSDVCLPIGPAPLTTAICVLDFENHAASGHTPGLIRRRLTFATRHDPGLILNEKPPMKHPREAAVSTAGPAGAGTPEEETAMQKRNGSHPEQTS